MFKMRRKEDELREKIRLLRQKEKGLERRERQLEEEKSQLFFEKYGKVEQEEGIPEPLYLNRKKSSREAEKACYFDKENRDRDNYEK